MRVQARQDKPVLKDSLSKQLHIRDLTLCDISDLLFDSCILELAFRRYLIKRKQFLGTNTLNALKLPSGILQELPEQTR